jgi:multidrug efflux pump subunit AcrB
VNIFQLLIQKKAFVNVLMVVFLVGGLISATLIRQQLMPDRIEPVVNIEVDLPGASPEEVEQSALTLIENKVRGLQGVKRVTCEALEGKGNVIVLLQFGVDRQQMLGDIKARVDSINTFPKNADKPVVSLSVATEKALSLVVFGDQPQVWLQRSAEHIKDDLISEAGLTRVELSFPRKHELRVYVDEERLRQFGLSIGEIGESIRKNNQDISGGTLHATHWDAGLRSISQKKTAAKLGTIPVIQDEKGGVVLLSDLADIREELETTDIETWFNGYPAVVLDVFTASGESPGAVAEKVEAFINNTARTKYQGVQVQIFENQAAAYHGRLLLLVNNALTGLLLVLAVLWLFLAPRPAFWVTMGIPTALLGGLMLMYLMGTTINMLSLFAFIITLGVVVDDAIVMGEAIHQHREEGLDGSAAATRGFRKTGGPLLLAVSTTILAFVPMCFVPGELGNMFNQIPAVIILVLLVSLVESLVILPVHLGDDGPQPSFSSLLSRPQQYVNKHLNRFVHGRFRKILAFCLQHPSLPLVIALCLLVFTGFAVSSGVPGFSMTPSIEADTVIAQATLPYGSPKSESVDIQNRLVASAKQVLEEAGMESPGMLSLIGTRLEEGEVEVESLAGTHYISMLTALPSMDLRTISGREFARRWRQTFGHIGNLETINFTGEINISGGEPIQLELMHYNSEKARSAAVDLGKQMRAVPGLTSIDDGVQTGKPELRFRLKEEGAVKGLSAEALGWQTRHRFHGMEAARFMQDGKETTILIQLTEQERSNLASLDHIQLQLPDHSSIPLDKAATITHNRSPTRLMRRDGVRIYPVSADISYGYSDDSVEEKLEENILPELMDRYPGLQIRFGGEAEENSEALTALVTGFAIVLAVMYLLMVFYYNSIMQPLLVVTVIPFAFVGAIWGHILLGYHLSIISIVGIVAMTGVVVNDSIVLLSGVNALLARGIQGKPAILDAACDRFRPILLTTLTTFLGLLPLMLETSEQAQFLVPAAISMAFGLMSGTLITLLLFPVLLSFVTQKQKSGQSSERLQHGYLLVNNSEGVKLT